MKVTDIALSMIEAQIQATRMGRPNAARGMLKDLAYGVRHQQKATLATEPVTSPAPISGKNAPSVSEAGNLSATAKTPDEAFKLLYLAYLDAIERAQNGDAQAESEADYLYDLMDEYGYLDAKDVKTLSSLPDTVQFITLMDSGGWTRYEGKRGGKGWKNSSTGRIIYTDSDNAPGHRRRQQEASHEKASELSEKIWEARNNGQEISHDHLRELADHLPKLSKEKLKTVRDTLMTSFGNARRRDEMLEALKSHIGRRISGEHQEPKEESTPKPKKAKTKSDIKLRENGTPHQPDKNDVYTVDPSQIHVDPKRFQYKVSGIGHDGVTSELKGVKTWNPELGGTLLVWRDPNDGKDYVINGHHRHELASRLGADKLNVRYIDAGTPEEARARGALANIAEGRGTATDAAKYLRDTGADLEHLQRAGVSLSGKVAADAASLKDLSDRSFNRMAQGAIPEDTAVAVAKHLKDHALQDKLFDHLDKRSEDGKDWSRHQIETAARKMAKAGKVSTTENTLWGDMEDEKSTFDQEVELESHISRELAKRANDYHAISNQNRADRVAGAGNSIAVSENQKRLLKAQQDHETFSRESGLVGDHSKVIQQHAAELLAAKTKKEKENVKQRALEAIDALNNGQKPNEAQSGTTGSSGAGASGNDETGTLGANRPDGTPEGTTPTSTTAQSVALNPELPGQYKFGGTLDDPKRKKLEDHFNSLPESEQRKFADHFGIAGAHTGLMDVVKDQVGDKIREMHARGKLEAPETNDGKLFRDHGRPYTPSMFDNVEPEAEPEATPQPSQEPPSASIQAVEPQTVPVNDPKLDEPRGTPSETAQNGSEEPWQLSRSEWDQKDIPMEPHKDGKGDPMRFASLEQAAQTARNWYESGHIGRYEVVPIPKKSFFELQRYQINSAPSHQQEVERAVHFGKPVPYSVLKDYPDLVHQKVRQDTLAGNPIPDDIKQKYASIISGMDGDLRQAVYEDKPVPYHAIAHLPELVAHKIHHDVWKGRPIPDDIHAKHADSIAMSESTSGKKALRENPSEQEGAAAPKPKKKEVGNPEPTPQLSAPAPDPLSEEAGNPPPDENLNPREQAQSQPQSSQYQFARNSAVGNFGEDLHGSARHKANMWKGLDEAEKDGTAAQMMTRDNLLKVEPHTLMSSITPPHALSHLAAHLALQAFPKDPFTATDFESYVRSHTRHYKEAPTHTEESLRKAYFDSYQKIKAEAEKAANEELDPKNVVKRIDTLTRSLIKELRQEQNTGIGGEALGKDGFNPVGNALVDLHKRIRQVRGSAGSTSVIPRVEDFAKRAMAAYATLQPEQILEKLSTHAQDVIEGDSFNKTFGTVGKTKPRFNPSDAYVNHAERKGGRVIDAKTIENGKNFMMNNLGLRGVQWGNYVTDDERQHHLTKSSEALADLADVLGLPDSAISLGGKLGLAIGARGIGGARAHYESDTQVINLTRASGVGSLAHEWGHALDHAMEDFRLGKSEPVFHTTSGAGRMGKAMMELRKKMGSSGFADRLRKHINQQVNDGQLPKNAMDYWTKPEEMFARTFERFVQHKLHESDRENTYLVGLHKETNPLWPNADEMKQLAPHMEELLKEIREKHAFAQPKT